MQKSKVLKLFALMLVIVLCTSACSGVTRSSPELSTVVLPEPESAPSNQILGDASTVDSREVTLHYASENSVSLASVTRSISVDQNESLVGNVLSELLFASHGDIRRPVEANLVGFESGSGIVTVDLSIEAGVNRSDQDYMLLCASIANTLLEIEGTEAVNILTGSRSDPVARLPLGAFSKQLDNIPAAYAQSQSEAQRVLDEGNGFFERNVVLYFPAVGGEYLLPEIHSLSFDGSDYVSGIIAALSGGPERECCFAAVPGSFDLLVSTPVILANDAGERIIELNFNSMIANYLALAGVEPWQLYASVVLSLCSFVPEIDGVRVFIGNMRTDNCIMGDQTLSFENGVMRRSDFTSVVGSSAQLYFAGEADALATYEIPMSQSASVSAMGLLSELVSSDNIYPTGLKSVFPEGIAQEDILGVSIKNRTAIVNLSGNFYARCQALSPMQERMLIYAMVNTLSELDHIGAVRFLVEGETVDSLAQNIYLKTALMPDPGLVQNLLPENMDENN